MVTLRQPSVLLSKPPAPLQLQRHQVAPREATDQGGIPPPARSGQLLMPDRSRAASFASAFRQRTVRQFAFEACVTLPSAAGF
jgi:hypothetical protein